MKTLESVAKKSTLPVLNNIHIENGIARATQDLDFFIEQPTDIKDGLYHAEGIGKGFYRRQL